MARSAVTKPFWARPKYEFGNHDSNNLWKNNYCMSDFGSKLPREIAILAPPWIRAWARVGPSAELTIVVIVTIATGPALLGAPRSSVTNHIYYIIYKIFQSKNQHFAKFAISRKRTFPIERCLCPNILVWFFLYSYVTKGIKLRSAMLPF